MGTNTASIHVTHQGGDRLLIETRGHQLRSDQPVEDGGDDSAPTPTELFLAGLAGCVAFYGARFLRRHGLATEGLAVTCNYAWAANPTRIGAIDLSVEAPALTADRREAFSRVIEHCTVHNTLLQPPQVRIRVASAQAATP
jgi:Predicted redox protein, regulator of disulfide bond formation